MAGVAPLPLGVCIVCTPRIFSTSFIANYVVCTAPPPPRERGHLRQTHELKKSIIVLLLLHDVIMTLKGCSIFKHSAIFKYSVGGREYATRARCVSMYVQVPILSPCSLLSLARTHARTYACTHARTHTAAIVPVYYLHTLSLSCYIVLVYNKSTLPSNIISVTQSCSQLLILVVENATPINLSATLHIDIQYSSIDVPKKYLV